MSRLKYSLLALRPHQWLKNMLLFSAIFFNQKLFDFELLRLSFFGFVVFCLISSASYLFNDIIDYPSDINHPLKKRRPLASGKITPRQAKLMAVFVFVSGLLIAFAQNMSFFLLACGFVVLHILYTLKFKQIALLDIFSIALSFIIRILASEVLTGYHLSVWLTLTIFFASLFIAAAKRHAELFKRGTANRTALNQYEERLLNFYVATFATSAIFSYCLFAFMQPTLSRDSGLAQLLISISMPKMIERKWLLLSTPLFVFGITRYAQLVYIGKKGESPERVITTDKWLIGAVFAWGSLMFILLYL